MPVTHCGSRSDGHPPGQAESRSGRHGSACALHRVRARRSSLRRRAAIPLRTRSGTDTRSLRHDVVDVHRRRLSANGAPDVEPAVGDVHREDVDYSHADPSITEPRLSRCSRRSRRSISETACGSVRQLLSRERAPCVEAERQRDAGAEQLSRRLASRRATQRPGCRRRAASSGGTEPARDGRGRRRERE